MARGSALVQDVLPLLEDRLSASLDGHATERLAEMLERYASFIARERSRQDSVATPAAAEGDG
jgi:hypothetical protein